jgi:ATP/maltotriose-dependent transcriptional regulator MalT
LQWAALGHGALCRALQGRLDEAEALLVELAKSWRDVRALVSGEWIDVTAHAAFLSGRTAAVAIRDMLADVPHRTPWVEAALRTVTAGTAFADGDFGRAARLHLAAADIFAEIPHQSARMLSLAWAARSLRRLGDEHALAPVAAELTVFAQAVEAPRLLELALEE